MAITVQYSPVTGALEAAAQTGSGQATIQRHQLEQQMVQSALQNQQSQDQLAAQQYNQAQNRALQQRQMQLQQQLDYAKMQQQMRMQNARLNAARDPFQQALEKARTDYLNQKVQANQPVEAPSTGSGGYGVVGTQGGPVTVLSGATTMSGSNLQNAEQKAQQTKHPEMSQALQSYASGGGGGVTTMSGGQKVTPRVAAKLATLKQLDLSHLPTNTRAMIESAAQDPNTNLMQFLTAARLLMHKPSSAHGLTASEGLTDIRSQITQTQSALKQIVKDYGFSPADATTSIADYKKAHAASHLPWGSAGWTKDKIAALKRYQTLYSRLEHLQGVERGQNPLTNGGMQQPHSYQMPNGRTVSMSDIQQTAQKHGQTVEQVIQNLHLTPVQ